ncbi:hypothetical protein K6W16_21820 [Burkholderia dolosa]|uniref:Uncharacterized protein n=1 Tax=Burkholderia dolosa TaxID=152500 RepID=A0A892IFR8_9BURK|nr:MULTISPECIES: hypothetical protein [Burkholderia]AKE05929.1 hypothetical protein XM57_25465 [Burkholderia cepacia]AJY10863.1 hypothetical protein AK34_3998 [Burkholderia dolosa AU0158]AYZ93738.1 hypothetical protein EGY28_00630 [Burkholderia dolosa]EAY70538.1 hypothetical protein BDAG_03338 [Burkholderia dolosa AU0158]ETP62541.1 hypothetical protein BDSB_19525 [Burkholderia dolosa PC543]
MTNLNIDTTALAARLRWGVYAATRKLRTPGVLAACAAVALLGLHALYLQPGVVRLGAMRDALAQELAELRTPSPAVGAGGMTLKEVQQLRTGERAYSLFEILSQYGIERKQATYRRDTEAKGKLRRLTIDIALAGHYVGLREAMRKIADQPMVRIERVVIERDKVDNPVVDADLQVSLLGPDR